MKILYVEDDPRDADLARRELARSAPQLDMEVAADLGQARALLARGTDYDLVLADLHLPDGNGLELLTEIREQELSLAVVILTGAGDEAAAVGALQAGADDYLVKRHDYLVRLPQALASALDRYRRETERRARPLRVLYVEHHQADADLTARHLARHAPHIRLEVVLDTEQVLARLPRAAGEPYPCDVLLLDYRLPGTSGLALLKTLRDERKLDLPVVLVTGQGNEGVAVQALRLGAVDYLIKHAGYLHELPATLENAFHRAELIRERLALRESESRFRRLAENAPDIIFRVRLDPEMRFEYVSPAAAAIIGYMPQDHYADPLLGDKILHPDDRPFLLAALEDGSAFTQPLTLRWLHKDGTPLWIEQRTVPIRDSEGNLIAIEGIARDISRRVQANEAIRLGAQRLALATDAAGIGIFDLDLVTDELVWDERMFALYQVQPQDFDGTVDFWQRCLHPDDRPAMQDRVRDAIAGRGDLLIHFRIVWPDGQVRYIEARGLVQRAPDGTPLRMIGVNWDISERRQAEAEREQLLARIRAQAQQVQQIVDSVPEGVLLLNADGTVMLANPLGERDLALLAGARVGDVLTHLGDRPLAELLTSPPKGLWHELGSGERVFEALARPIQKGAEPESWVLVVKDVTHERRVRRQLQQQERLAAVGQLAAGIAHDFNNLLAVIILYAQMSRQQYDLPPELTERLEIIEGQTKQATQLIQQILDFSRSAVLDRQALELREFMREVLELLRRTLPENIEISLAAGPGDLTLSADPTRIQQVILNLAINARDAMPDGGQLRIGLDRVLVSDVGQSPLPGMPAGAWVRLTVADDGFGIPADALPHIFEPFFTTKDMGRGTGLGLAQVYGIVSQHDGWIDVTSSERQGTIFTLYLPLLESTPLSDEAMVAAEIAQGRGETILVVEDNVNLRIALTASLMQLNYHVQEAENGAQALEILDTAAGERIALVLSDVVMPVMGGIALLHAMQQRALQTPVILLTGHPLEQELQELALPAFKGWLLKPLNLPQLARLVADVLA